MKLKETLEALNKAYGQNTVAKMEDIDAGDVTFLSSGSLGIDEILGGGWARGRIIEIFGPESSGKTTLTLHAIAECQKDGGIAAFIDMEHTFDKKYATALGVDTDSLLFSQPSNGEEALEIGIKLMATNEVHLIVIDSVSNLIPKSEDEGEMGDANVAVQARMMSKAMRKYPKAASRSDCCVIFINQIRMKIGVMFGSPETTSGGNALKFNASQRVDIRRSSPNKDKDGNAISHISKVKCIKNKVAPPFGICEVTMEYGQGISRAQELVDLGVAYEIIDKKGSWFSYNGNKLGQGALGVKELIEDNPELADELTEKIRKKLAI